MVSAGSHRRQSQGQQRDQSDHLRAVSMMIGIGSDARSSRHIVRPSLPGSMRSRITRATRPGHVASPAPRTPSSLCSPCLLEAWRGGRELSFSFSQARSLAGIFTTPRSSSPWASFIRCHCRMLMQQRTECDARHQRPCEPGSYPRQDLEHRIDRRQQRHQSGSQRYREENATICTCHADSSRPNGTGQTTAAAAN
jgi:hypothetical protein